MDVDTIRATLGDKAVRVEQIGGQVLIQGDCLEVMPLLGKVDAVDNRNAVVFNHHHEQTAIRQYRTPERCDENLGSAAVGDCGAIPDRQSIPSVNGAALWSECGGVPEGDCPHGNPSKEQGKGGSAERSVYRRDAIDGIQGHGREDALQQMRGDGSTRCASCGRSSHEQRGREFGSAVQPLPFQPPQTGVVEFEKGWAILTDPPYGIGEDGGRFRDRKGGGHRVLPKMQWDKARPPKKAFDLILGFDCQTIIWGGNYFADLLPASKGWLYWDKLMGGDFADGELAWTNLDRALRKFTMCNKMGGKQHPTQKPIALMEWCLGFLPNAQTILDPFMGSGTTLVACQNLDRNGIGVELDPDYFQIACKRVDEATRQPRLFSEPAPKPTQEGWDL